MGTRVQVIVKDSKKNVVVLSANASQFEPEKVVRDIAKRSFGQTTFVRELLNHNHIDRFSDTFNIDFEPFGDYEFTLEVFADSFQEKIGLAVNKIEGVYTEELLNKSSLDYIGQ